MVLPTARRTVEHPGSLVVPRTESRDDAGPLSLAPACQHLRQDHAVQEPRSSSTMTKALVQTSAAGDHDRTAVKAAWAKHPQLPAGSDQMQTSNARLQCVRLAWYEDQHMKVQMLMVLSHAVADDTSPAVVAEAHIDDESVLRMLADAAAHVEVAVDDIMVADVDN